MVIKPMKGKMNVERLRESLRTHVEALRRIPGRREPKPGELARISLEEEFDE